MLPLVRSSTRGAGLFQIVAPRLSPCPSLVRSIASSSSLKQAASPARRPPSNAANGVITFRDLEREVADLGHELSRLEKAREVEEATRNLPPLREEDLDSFYEALKAPDPPTPEEQRLAARLQRRLEASAIPRSRQDAHLEALRQLSGRLSAARIETGSQDAGEGENQVVAARTMASSMVDGVGKLLEAIKKDVAEADVAPSAESPRLPSGLVTRSEWKALAGLCAAQSDDAALLRLIDAAKYDPAVVTPVDLVDEALDAYARKGDLARCQALLRHLRALKLEPTEHTHHSLVKAHLRAGLPDKAAELLKSLESSTPAGLPTYTMVLSNVMNHRVPDARLQLWPMFHRMRMAAHPVPDGPLYALMIRACALGITPTSPGGEPDVERALDLFREMTTRYGVRPTAEAYNALILACARRKDMHVESLRLLREMVALERSRSESGLSGFAPDRATYNALLQGCARTGDLLHARWALAEMLRSSVALWAEKGGEEEQERQKEMDAALIEARRPDAQTLTAVFWTYASYRLPAGSGAATVKAAESKTGEADEAQPASDSPSSEETSVTPTEAPQSSPSSISFTDSLPRTSAELVTEVRALMARIEADNEVPGLLSTVKPSAPLLYAYASALAAHLPSGQRLEAVEEIVLGRASEELESPSDKAEGERALAPATSNSLFDRLGVKRQLHSYLVVLETAAKVSNRRRADAVSDRAWAMVEAYEEKQRVKLLSSLSPCGDGASESARKVSMEELAARQASSPQAAGRSIFTTRATAEALSECYAARIHGLAKSNRLDEAMSLVRSFAERFPVPPRPKVGRKPTDLLAEADVGALSLGRLRESRAASTAPAWPRLTFKHLDMLHHRLVAQGVRRRRDLSFVHWLTTRTEASLRPAMPRMGARERREAERGETREEVDSGRTRGTERMMRANRSTGGAKKGGTTARAKGKPKAEGNKKLLKF